MKSIQISRTLPLTQIFFCGRSCARVGRRDDLLSNHNFFVIITFSLMILSILVALCRSAGTLLRRLGELLKREDLISQLPDDVLVSIIARAPTKLAVSTSILSRRWRNLYKLTCADLVSRPTQNIRSHDSAIQRLERLLRLCSDSKLHRFQLMCYLSRSCLTQFEQCMHHLGKSGVEVLQLDFFCEIRHESDPVSFYCHLLSKLPSLKYLSLAFCSLQPTLNTKCYSLKALNLYFVTLGPRSFGCLLSNCLSLRLLTIAYSHCPLKLRFCSPNLRLSILRIMNCEGIQEIEFHTSYLISFELRSSEMVNLVFDHVPMLETIYLSSSLRWDNTMPYVWGKLCKDLPNLKSLTFDTRGFFDQDSIGLVPMLGRVTYSNLKRLAMEVLCSSKTNLLALIPFLESCPLLEEFHLDVLNMGCYDVAVERKHVVFPLRKLKMVEMTGFCGTDNEIELALYILRAATALEQMYVIKCVRYYRGCGAWRRKESHHETPWKEEIRSKIEKRLQGQALSNTANLVIQHESVFFATVPHEVEPWGD